MICVQSAVSSYFCFFDFACPDNYLGLLIFYLLLAIVVAILHSRQLNENKWKVPWIDLSLNEISVILMEIVLVVLAYQSPKIIAAGWIMILEIDASKWPLKISRIPDFIKYLKEHFPNIFISDHIGICVIVVVSFSFVHFLCWGKTVGVVIRKVNCFFQSNTIGTILKSFLNGNVEIKSSNSTTFSYSSMSPFFNKTEEINSLKTVESKMDFKLFTTENIISIAYSISVTLMAMVMTDWFNNWTTQIHLKVVQCLRNSSVIQIEPNPEQDIASKELRAKLKNCMPSEMLIHNNSDASFLNDETEAADLIIQNGTLLDSEENDQISFHSAISNFDDHGF